MKLVLFLKKKHYQNEYSYIYQKNPTLLYCISQDWISAASSA